MKIKADGKEFKGPISEEDLQKLLNMLDTIKYGSITLVVQDSRVIQIEKSEKVRLK